MSTMETSAGLAGSIYPKVITRAAGDGGLASGSADEDRKLGWQTIIDDCLVEWGKNPSGLADEDLVPPSVEIIDLACKAAMEFRDQAVPPPLRVVPDGEGGISFEFRCGSCFMSLNILSDRSAELLTFRDCRLVSRRRLA